MPIQPGDPTYRAIVNGCRDRRGDDTPRLALCDYLDDNGAYGDPFVSLVREMIALVREEPRCAALGPRGWEWYGTDPALTKRQDRCHGWLRRTWLRWQCCRVGPDLPENELNQWRWVRGFPETVVCPLDHWADHWPLLTALGPVGEVFLTTWPYSGRTHHDGSNQVEQWVSEHRLVADVRARTGRTPRCVAVVDRRTFYSVLVGDHRPFIETWLRDCWPPGLEVENVHLEPELATVLVEPDPVRPAAPEPPAGLQSP